jgi:hypothetical protein
MVAMENIKQNMRWLAMVLLLMFAMTGTSVIIGHAIFISYFKQDIEQFKQRTLEEASKQKLVRIEI